GAQKDRENEGSFDSCEHARVTSKCRAAPIARNREGTDVRGSNSSQVLRRIFPQSPGLPVRARIIVGDEDWPTKLRVRLGDPDEVVPAKPAARSRPPRPRR